MRTQPFLRSMGDRGESAAPGTSSAGLRLISKFQLRRKSVPSFTANALRFFSPLFEGPWVSERAEAKENRKIPWNALLSRRMLAQGFVRGNEGRRKSGK